MSLGLFLFLCIYKSVSFYLCGCPWGQKRVLHLLEMELQMVVSSPAYVLGSRPQFIARAANSANCHSAPSFQLPPVVTAYADDVSKCVSHSTYLVLFQ